MHKRCVFDATLQMRIFRPISASTVLDNRTLEWHNHHSQREYIYYPEHIEKCHVVEQNIFLVLSWTPHLSRTLTINVSGHALTMSLRRYFSNEGLLDRFRPQLFWTTVPCNDDCFKKVNSRQCLIHNYWFDASKYSWFTKSNLLKI